MKKFTCFVIVLCIVISTCVSSAYAVENKIEKYWWGYRRYISNQEISKFSTTFDSMAAEFSFFGGLTFPITVLNPIAGVLIGGILEFSSSYCWLLSTYIVKVNKGNGVIVDYNKGVVFRIKGI